MDGCEIHFAPRNETMGKPVFVGVYVEESSSTRVSQVVQDFVHPQYHLTCFFLTRPSDSTSRAMIRANDSRARIRTSDTLGFGGSVFLGVGVIPKWCSGFLLVSFKPAP